MTVPNFVGTIWTTKAVTSSESEERRLATKVKFRDGGTGSAFLVKDGSATEYQVTWSVDANNLKLSWSMAGILDQGNTSYPLDFVNYWSLNYTTGPVVFGTGFAHVPVTGGTAFNFTQEQAPHYP